VSLLVKDDLSDELVASAWHPFTSPLSSAGIPKSTLSTLMLKKLQAARFASLLDVRLAATAPLVGGRSSVPHFVGPSFKMSHPTNINVYGPAAYHSEGGLKPCFNTMNIWCTPLSTEGCTTA
jgi:hypothetical protein